MESFSQKVKTFDAFPKVDPQQTVRSSRGGMSTIMTTFFGLFIVWIQIGGFLGGYTDQQFTVDDTISTAMSLNIEMVVSMPCKFLHTNVVDIANDRYLAGEVLNFQGLNGFILPDSMRINQKAGGFETPSIDEIIQEASSAEFIAKGMTADQDAPLCHIFGTVPINKVRGEFRITAKGFGYASVESTPMEALNFSHAVLEYSYGELGTYGTELEGGRKKLTFTPENLKESADEKLMNNFFPYMNNPLDFTAKVSSEKFQSYHYYTTIVPHTYEKLGIQIPTMQYSVTEQHSRLQKDESGRMLGVPGIFFSYDLEPIRLITSEKRLGFFEFLIKLGSIIGGFVVIASYAYRIYEKLLTVLYGKKFANRTAEKYTGGLLD